MGSALKIFPGILVCLLLFSHNIDAQYIYELRKLTDDDWLKMSTEERLEALNISNNRARNQSFLGNFNRNYDLYPRWGYDFYEMSDRYENYAFRGFENYYVIEDRRNKWYYNQFGDRLTKMTRSAWIWKETHNDNGTSLIQNPSKYINSQVDTDGIWVAQESTDDWAISAVGAGSLRAKLSPLTLSIPNLDGMKIDFHSKNFQASMLNSALIGKESLRPLHVAGIQSGTMSNTITIRGFQLRRKFGALTLGTNYANMYSRQPNRDGGDRFDGTVSDYMPTPLFYAVRVLDDSPHDGGGPIVHDVKLKVNGQYRPDILPFVVRDDLRREKVTAIKSRAQQRYLEYPSPIVHELPPFDHTTVYERIPKYVDYLYLNDYQRGWNTKTLTDHFDLGKAEEYYEILNPGGKPVQVNGSEYVVYLFDLGGITDNVNRVEAEITVENDYRIQVAEIFTKSPKGGHDYRGENLEHYKSTFWKTMAQAEGNVKDGSNLRTVRVDFGFEVANIIYGFDMHFNYLGFKIDGEYVTNYHKYMFSDGKTGKGLPLMVPTDITSRTGHRSSIKDNAYYLIVQKNWRRFGFAGEYFKMGKFYRPHMQNYMPFENVGDVHLLWNDHVRTSLIADNDDDDQYPDVQHTPLSMAVSYETFLDPDGVFPGNDMDNDGFPDNEKNDNNMPDYDEPFLMFDIDPDEYVFGDDFNNNTIPDFREDDIKDDTPYDLDRRGHHVYIRYTPQENVNFFLGAHSSRGIGLDTRSDDNYMKVNINYNVFDVGSIFAEYRYERIQDNIQDSFVVVPTKRRLLWVMRGRTSRYAPPEFYYDEIEYRNSKVNKLYLDSRLRPFPPITIENHVRFERNEQIEGTMYDNTFQPYDDINILAIVNKFVYTRKIGNFTFSPGVKFRLYKKDRSQSIHPLDHYLLRIPLIYLRYRISPKSNITLGIQGFDGFEMHFKDYIQSYNDYKQINYILQIENKTDYFGFDIWGGFGFRFEDVRFDEDYRAFENYKSSSFFVRIWLGH